MKYDYIERGKERCKEKKLTINRNIDSTLMNQDEFKKLLKKKSFLLNKARPFMEKIHSFMEDSGFLVSLADENACIIDIVGQIGVYNSCLKPGVDWSEDNAGSNAVSLALYEKIPVQITGKQHYCSQLQLWGCSAAPIWFGNKIIGVLNISGPKEKVYPHTLGMVVAAAYAIENMLQVEEKNKELLIKHNFQEVIVESAADGLLTLDKYGIITFLNTAGAEILEVDKRESIGKHITEIVDFTPMILDVLKTGKGYIDKELIVKRSDGRMMHFIKTAHPIKDENGAIAGVVDTFRRIKQVKKLVNDMVGSYAQFTFEDIVGSEEDEAFLESIKMARIAAKSSSNVLIHGESGTGKELFAHSIHNASARAEQPFITVNCAALPRELIESELFGYEGGAFTGALKTGRPGKFELANGGTIFLDEIGDMPLDMQVKLLRVIQERQITRIGGNNVFHVDVRIICATNKKLTQLCREGSFRHDLFYRLDVLNIETIPLRNRPESIKKLVDYLLNKLNKKMGKNVSKIDEKVMEAFINYQWPGNVRELENILERAVNICEMSNISIDNLPNTIILPIKGFQSCTKLGTKTIMCYETLENLEKKHIMNIIQSTQGNISRAAELLGVSRNTLYNKLKKYHVKT